MRKQVLIVVPLSFLRLSLDTVIVMNRVVTARYSTAVP
jgi:hypothetical protein